MLTLISNWSYKCINVSVISNAFWEKHPSDTDKIMLLLSSKGNTDTSTKVLSMYRDTAYLWD